MTQLDKTDSILSYTHYLYVAPIQSKYNKVIITKKIC